MDAFNLDDFDAALAEEHLEPYPFTFMGEQFTVPNERLWPAEVADAIDRNQLWRLFSLLLGEDDLGRLREAGERSKVGRLTLSHLEHLMSGITTAQALRSPGESPAGEPTPASTGAPSSPTSNGSTASTSPPNSPAATAPASPPAASPG